jgi:hypothetical protein
MSRKTYFAVKILLVSFFCVLSADSLAVGSPVIRPFQKADRYEPHNEIDTIVMDSLRKKGVPPTNLCSDAVFIRRVYLDTNGTLPQVEDVRRFIENPRDDKRATLIRTLLKQKGFSEYWSLKWCDLLRVKAEFPINLWPNAVQAYHRWIQDAIAYNMPYDQFAHEMLTSSGSNFRVPQVNFYRAIQGQEPSSIANAAVLTFMGARFENWPKAKQDGMAAFFSQVAYNGTAEWKEEIVYLKPVPTDSLKAIFPDGTAAKIKQDQDPREVFAKWLTAPENPWFARNIVNRIWSWLLGRGIIHEPDDIRPDNPPVYPKLLAYLEKELIESEYDLLHIYRLILNSRTYQQSSIPHPGTAANAEKLFACYPVRQIEAEVLIDALCRISGTRESYSSPIPEPFTFIPPEHRTISLADGSITSQFLEMFGRPSRDTGLESERKNLPTETQRRHMLNSTHIQNKIERGWRLKNLVRRARGDRKKLGDSLYLTILSRYPTESEHRVVESYFKTEGISSNQATVDLAWALINSKEFLYRH